LIALISDCVLSLAAHGFRPSSSSRPRRQHRLPSSPFFEIYNEARRTGNPAAPELRARR